MIQRLSHTQIDYNRWNFLVDQSTISSVYAYTWFLDIVCPQWEGLILNDYEACIPIPVKKKWGLTYLVQPIFSQQYDIYTRKQLNQEEIQQFTKAIDSFFSIRIALTNPLFSKAQVRHNYQLALSKTYETIAKNYNQNTKRNIQKAKKYNLVCQKIDDYQTALHTFFQFDTKNLYSIHKTVIEQLIQAGHIVAYEVTDESHTLAITFFIQVNQRLYYLFPLCSDEGRNKSAQFLLVDFVIQSYATTNTIFDFEGSEQKGIQRFYEGFGAEPQEYYFIHRRHIGFQK